MLIQSYRFYFANYLEEKDLKIYKEVSVSCLLTFSMLRKYSVFKYFNQMVTY